MNDYKSGTEISSASAPTMTNLVGWSDQVAAATNDVREAWMQFRHGPRPVPQPEAKKVGSEDRFRLGIDTLQSSVEALHDIAVQIRDAT